MEFILKLSFCFIVCNT